MELTVDVQQATLARELAENWRTVLEPVLGVSGQTIEQMLRQLEEVSCARGAFTTPPRILVLSSGSATGKTHFGRFLRERGWTTLSRTKDRGIRPDEIEGVDGHYVDRVTFDDMERTGALGGITGSYGDRRGYELPRVLRTIQDHRRCVSSDGYSLVRLATARAELRGYALSSVYLLPPDLPTLIDRILSRAFARFVPSVDRTLETHFAAQKIGARLAEGPRYLREAFEGDGLGRPLVDRFVVYDHPERILRLLGLDD